MYYICEICLTKAIAQTLKQHNLLSKNCNRRLCGIFSTLPVVCTVHQWPSMCVCMSCKLLLVSLSCLFSRLSECVSLHWPSFRSYWEMAAPLKFNPLSHHSAHTDKRWRENSRDSQAGEQGCTGMYLTTDTNTHTNTHSFPKSELDMIVRDGEWRSERSYTDGK